MADATSAPIRITLTVTDPELVEELARHEPGADREEFALAALRIGVLTLKRAQGQLDADFITRETDRLLENMTGALKEFFDPKDGRFTERVERLIGEDGELEQLMRAQIGQRDSELARTLAVHIGEQSPFMELLSTDESKGFLRSLAGAIETRLDAQRKLLLKEFSLDEKDSALSRLVAHVKASQAEIVGEFSLDKKESALSRMKEELVGLLNEHEDANQKFRTDINTALAGLTAGREEAQRSTRHGVIFEEQAIEFIQSQSQRVGDVATPTGNTVGMIKNCKVGDAIVRLGPDERAAGARIAVEVKEKARYTLETALAEIDVARKNRGAGVGLFVFSKQAAPDGLDPMRRYGDDVVVVWDADDPGTDVFLVAGLSLARGLCTQAEARRESGSIDLEPLERAIRDIEKQVNGLDEIQTFVGTIESSAAKISSRVTIMRKHLTAQIDVLDDEIGALRSAVGPVGEKQAD